MATPLSEVIQYLQFDGVVAVGGEHETIKVLLQEFGSISCTITTDQNSSFVIEFSNDGVNFDYFTSNALASGTQTITSVILGKWCKLRIQNASRFDLNARFSTFAQVIPIATQAQVESTGNTLPGVNVENLSSTLFNELRVAQRKPVQTTNFTYYIAVGGQLIGPDRYFQQFNGGGATYVNSPANVVGNALTLSNIYAEAAGAYHFVRGTPVVIEAGNPVYINISCGFTTAGYTNGTTLGYDMMLSGMGYVDEANGQIVDGFYIGYPSAPVPPNTIVDEICFVIYASGFEIAIPKSQWTFDRLDGRGPSAITLDPTKLSTWRIRVAITSNAYIEYHNPDDNEWIPCHRVVGENLFTTTGVSNPSFAFNSYTRRTSTASGLAIVNGCGPLTAQGVVGVEVGESSLPKLETYNIVDVVTPVVGVETEIFSMRNGTIYNTKTNRSIIFANDMFASVTGGTAPVIIRVYKNATFGAVFWAPKDTVNEPTDTSSGSWTAGTGANVAGFLVSPGSTEKIDLNDVNANLGRLDTLTFTCQSTAAVTGVTCLVNYSLVN